MKNYKRLPAMDFAESVSKVLNNMFKFDGRSRRSELWWYYLAYMLATMLVNLLLTSRPLKSPFLRDIVFPQYLADFMKHAPKSFHGSFEVIGCCRQ